MSVKGPYLCTSTVHDGAEYGVLLRFHRHIPHVEDARDSLLASGPTWLAGLVPPHCARPCEKMSRMLEQLPYVVVTIVPFNASHAIHALESGRLPDMD